MPPQASEDFYRTLQRLQLVLVAAGRRAWSRMRPDFDPSWAEVAPSLVTVTAASQLAAARAATEYMPAVLAETEQPDRPEARVRPRAFAGVASDGRSLVGLLEGSVRQAKVASGRGMAADDALAYGGRWLEMALQTAVEDAARDATAAEIVVRQNMGWVRMINPPCCSRCAVLAGKWYRWNDGFLRHPRCDCVHIPTVENAADDYVTDPQLLVQRGLITDLSKAQQGRLSEGADLTRVLNESRDAWRARMAVERKKKARETATVPPPAASVNDFLSRLTSRVDAINEMRAAGFVD